MYYINFFLVPPLFVVEFLHRVVDTITDYFNECSEAVIKDNYVVVYELLDEMLDNGFPLATESNILKELIKPPNILRTVVNTVTGKTKSVLLILCSFSFFAFFEKKPLNLWNFFFSFDSTKLKSLQPLPIY